MKGTIRLTEKTAPHKPLVAGCWSSIILSPINCSEKMSPYERRGDIDQERADQVDGIKRGGGGGIGWGTSC